MAATTAPGDGLWVTVRGNAEHLTPNGYAPTVGWAPITRLVDEGAKVQPQTELLRFSEDQLRSSNDRDLFELNRDDQRRRLDLLNSHGDIAQLLARISSLESRANVLTAELAAAESVDPERITIAELQLANARTAHASAAQRRKRLEHLAASGGAVSANELARAGEDEISTHAAIAAPTATLALARLPAAASTVAQLRFALGEVRSQLGDSANSGLIATLRTAEERQRRRALDGQRSDNRRREFQRRVDLLRDPVIRSTTTGTVQFRTPEVRIGGRLPMGINCIFVLDQAGLAARIQVPQKMRALVSLGTRVLLAVPGLTTTPLSGTVVSLAAAPEDGNDGQLNFPACVTLERIPDGLRPGMSAEARIAVAVPAPAIIPSFCVADPENPLVNMADGSSRRLEGWAVAGWFVAVNGLAPGEHVRVPADAPATGSLRLTALIEPEHAIPVNLRSDNWEPVELTPDGTPVKAGQRLARMTKLEFWRMPDDVRAEVDVIMARARLDLAIQQLAAADEQASARGDWIRATIAKNRARLLARTARFAVDPVAAANTEAALATARLGLDRANRDLATARSEQAVGAISAVQLRVRELAQLRADTASSLVGLEAAATELGQDQVLLRGLDDATTTADETETASRALRLIAGEAYRRSLAGALAGFESTRRWTDRTLSYVADEEVTAPVDGVLIYSRTRDGLPRLGRKLQTMVPFCIATSTRLRAVFELPARLYGRLHANDRIRLSGVGTGSRVEAEVVKIAAAFLPSRNLVAELALGRTVGDEDRVFQVTVAFDPPPGAAAGLAPGMEVHADF